jgi:hypothetical protein
MEKLTWHIEKRRVVDLKTWDRNPRTITEEAFQRLKQRITARGFHDVIKADLDNTVLSGNQRKTALLQLGVAEVECIVPNRPLTDKERDEVAIESNRNDGEWDMAGLQNFDQNLLLEQGFTEKELVLLNPEIDDNIFLPNGEKEAIENMTFTFSSEQAEQVKLAIKLAKNAGNATASDNENSNGNALWYICEQFITNNNE